MTASKAPSPAAKESQNVKRDLRQRESDIAMVDKETHLKLSLLQQSVEGKKTA